MEQRRLRLGDILDDYCPRERRVTNHAVVAMIEEDIKQTRCTTCDAEHAYKGARVPKRRKKDTPVTASPEPVARQDSIEEPDLPMQSDDHSHDGFPAGSAPDLVTSEVPYAPPAESVSDELGHTNAAREREGEEADALISEGPVHRRLIRATLPRPEGQKDARPLPEFTVRHATGRGNGHGGFRGERMRMRGGNAGEPNRNRAQAQPSRFHGQRPPAAGRPPTGRGGGAGFRAGKGKRGRGSRG